MFETAETRPNIVWPLIYDDHFKPGGPKQDGVEVEKIHEVIDIDTAKTIRKVSVLIDERQDYGLCGNKYVVKAIKMQSDDKKMVCSHHWCVRSGGKWYT